MKKSRGKLKKVKKNSSGGPTATPQKTCLFTTFRHVLHNVFYKPSHYAIKSVNLNYANFFKIFIIKRIILQYANRKCRSFWLYFRTRYNSSAFEIRCPIRPKLYCGPAVHRTFCSIPITLWITLFLLSRAQTRG